MPSWNPKKFLAEFFQRADTEMAGLTIRQLYTLIDLELAGDARQTVLTRLHRRLCTRRTRAERARLQKEVRSWRA